jgi:hypothetical protein
VSYRITADFARRLVACLGATFSAVAAVLLVRAVVHVAFGTPAGGWLALYVLALAVLAVLVAVGTYRSVTRPGRSGRGDERGPGRRGASRT